MATRTDGRLTLEDLFDWVREEVKGVPYGEVGIVFTLNDGKIVKQKRISSPTFTAGKAVAIISENILDTD